MKGSSDSIENEPSIHYFTVGEESWYSGSSWPPVNTKNLQMFLEEDYLLDIDEETEFRSSLKSIKY